MKALALLTAAAATLFNVAASAQSYGVPYGKGKAPPPPPVVTKASANWGDRPLCRSLSLWGAEDVLLLEVKRTSHGHARFRC